MTHSVERGGGVGGGLNIQFSLVSSKVPSGCLVLSYQYQGLVGEGGEKGPDKNMLTMNPILCTLIGALETIPRRFPSDLIPLSPLFH